MNVNEKKAKKNANFVNMQTKLTLRFIHPLLTL